LLLGVLGNALMGGVRPSAVAAVIAGLLATTSTPRRSADRHRTRERFRPDGFRRERGHRRGVWPRHVAGRAGRHGQIRGPAGGGLRRPELRGPVHAVDPSRVGFTMRSVLVLSTTDPARPGYDHKP